MADNPDRQDQTVPAGRTIKERPRLLKRRGRTPQSEIEQLAGVKRPVNPLTGTPSNPLPQEYQDKAIGRRMSGDQAIVQVLGDDWHRRLLGEAARVDEGMPTENAFDETARTFRERLKKGPETTLAWLNPQVIARHARGMRGWKPVSDETGGPVTLAGQILAEMPTDVAKRRRRSNYEEREALRARKKEDSQEKRERIAVDSGGLVRPMSEIEAQTFVGIA